MELLSRRHLSLVTSPPTQVGFFERAARPYSIGDFTLYAKRRRTKKCDRSCGIYYWSWLWHMQVGQSFCVFAFCHHWVFGLDVLYRPASCEDVPILRCSRCANFWSRTISKAHRLTNQTTPANRRPSSPLYLSISLNNWSPLPRSGMGVPPPQRQTAQDSASSFGDAPPCL
jgi:hypothetical protein